MWCGCRRVEIGPVWYPGDRKRVGRSDWLDLSSDRLISQVGFCPVGQRLERPLKDFSLRVSDLCRRGRL
jgi:hypothetical protein